MPKASIVIPCYNASNYVAESVSSAQSQTIDDIEIICVDDGSTDDTLGILEHIASQDSRIRIIIQANGGEGPARDAGLDAAGGDWLYFLDADDIMYPTLLEESIACGEREQSDIVIFKTTLLDDKTGEQRPCPWAFKREWIADDTFNPREYPKHIFDSFQNWVHNKIFRGDFVREHDLHMQHVHRTADLLFTCRALAEASHITLLDRPLYLYRMNNSQSAMNTSDQYPLDFYQGFVALKQSLVAHGTWELYHDSFVNWALEGIAVNLRLSHNYEAYHTITETIVREGFQELDIINFAPGQAYLPHYYEQLRPLMEASLNESSSEETLFRIAASYRTECENALTAASFERLRNAEMEKKLEEVRARLRQKEEPTDVRTGVRQAVLREIRRLVRLPNRQR